MVSLVELPTLEETLQNENQRPQLGVLFLEKFNQLYTVNTVGPVERDIHINIGLFVLKFDQRHLGVFQGLNRLTDTRLYQSV